MAKKIYDENYKLIGWEEDEAADMERMKNEFHRREMSEKIDNVRKEIEKQNNEGKETPYESFEWRYEAPISYWTNIISIIFCVVLAVILEITGIKSGEAGVFTILKMAFIPMFIYAIMYFFVINNIMEAEQMRYEGKPVKYSLIFGILAFIISAICYENGLGMGLIEKGIVPYNQGAFIFVELIVGALFSIIAIMVVCALDKLFKHIRKNAEYWDSRIDELKNT